MPAARNVPCLRTGSNSTACNRLYLQAVLEIVANRGGAGDAGTLRSSSHRRRSFCAPQALVTEPTI